MFTRKRTSKIIALIMGLTLIVGMLAGCGSSKSKGKEISDKEMTIAVTSFADTLEPTEQYFAWVITRYGVGECLTKFDEKGDIKPNLATKWSQSNGGKTWTFEIRKDVKFSNGKPLTAEAVKASLERTAKMSNRVADLFDLKQIRAEGDKVIIELNKATTNMQGVLAEPLFLIMDTSETNRDIKKLGPICTGPYVVKSFNPATECVVERNKHYWGGKVPFEKVTLKCINDQKTREMALKSGEVQMAYNLKAENLPTFEKNDDFTISKLKSLRTTMAFMNQNGPLKDKKLRQAVISALDKKTYCEKLLKGAASPGKAPLPPTLDFGFDKLKDENKYDPSRSKKILKEAGYKDVNGDGYVEKPDGSKLQLNFVIYTSREELGTYAQAVQANLKEVGIDVKITTLSYEAIMDVRDSGKYDLMIWNVLVANTGDPESFLKENWYSKSKLNTSGYSNPKVDELLDKLSSTFDKAERKKIIIEIEQTIMDDAAVISLGYETTLLIYSSQLEGVKMYPMDYYWLTKDIKVKK